MEPRPFRIDVPDDVLADLQTRLGRARWPDEIPGSGWAYGTNLAYLRELTAYWRDGYDWRAQEALLNQFQHFTAPVAGIDLHFIHQPGQGPNPRPLLLSHGWPGSVWEFYKIIPLLTDPARFGGDPADAFTVVAPSLPGYGFSFRPGQPRFGTFEIAEAFGSLMTETLGYQRFAAQGGDWGCFITARMAFTHPERLAGIHLNMLPVRRELKELENLSPEEHRFQTELRHWLQEEMGYQGIQGTKPQTLAYGLTDSPVGLAGWIVEKMRTWSDRAGGEVPVLSMDEILTNIMIYWTTGAIGSSFWPYLARMKQGWPFPENTRIDVPTAYAEFPAEMLHPPRSLAEESFNIQRWTVMPAGGHFAAFEQPELLAEDIRAFFRERRG